LLDLCHSVLQHFQILLCLGFITEHVLKFLVGWGLRALIAAVPRRFVVQQGGLRAESAWILPLLSDFLGELG